MSRRLSERELEAMQARLQKPQGKVANTIISRLEGGVVKRNKHGNTRVKIDGINFGSKVEVKRYRQLQLLQDCGVISDLQCQVSFELAPAVHLKGKHRMSPPLRYFADFVYCQDGKLIVEDVKGADKVTEGFRIKRHLMATVHGIHIIEIRDKK